MIHHADAPMYTPYDNYSIHIDNAKINNQSVNQSIFYADSIKAPRLCDKRVFEICTLLDV